MKVICFIIHGIGPQQPNFSTDFRQRLDKCLSKLIAEESRKQPDLWTNITQSSQVVEYHELFWASVSTGEQEELYRTIYPNLFVEGGGVRGMSIRLIGDVFSYLGKCEEEIKRTVFSSFIRKLKEKCDAKEPFSVIIVGHSLGSVILHDIISGLLDYRYAELEKLLPATSVFTMGAPLSLFSLVTGTVDPAKFRLWENFLHSRDLIAFPMHAIFKSVKDIEVSSPFTISPLSAHNLYWSNKNVCSRIAQEIVCHVTTKVTIDPSELRLPKEIPPEVLQPSHGPALTAGFSDYQVDFGKIPFDELIEGATKIDICNVYGGTWYKKNAQYLVRAFQRPEVEVRVCMLSPTSPALPGFCYHFSQMSEAKLKENIDDSKKAIMQAFNDAKQTGELRGCLKVYLSKNIINHGFYRFDDLIYFTPRPMCSPKNAATPIPTIVFRKRTTRTDDYASWIMKDFSVLLQTNDDSVLDFDSQTVQAAAPPQKP